MTVTIATKVKATPVAAKVVSVVKAGPGLEFPVPLVEALVDKYDAFQKAKKKAEAAEKEYRPVEEDVREVVAAAKLDATAEVEFAYNKRTILIGKQKQVTEFLPGGNKAAMDRLETLKPGLAYELMKFKLEDLRTYLTPDELATIVKADDTGARGVKVK